MDSGFLGMPSDWTPPPPPVVGSEAWKNDMALKQVSSEGGFNSRTAVYRLRPCEGHDLGYFCIWYHKGRGYDYFRVDSIDDLVKLDAADKGEASHTDQSATVGKEAKFQVGQRVRILKNIWELADGDSPGGMCAKRGDEVIVRRIWDTATYPISVSHEDRTDGNTFCVSPGEIEVLASHSQTSAQTLVPASALPSNDAIRATDSESKE